MLIFYDHDGLKQKAPPLSEVKWTRATKKAEVDAKKNVLRTESIAKGVFVPVSQLPKTEPRIAERTARFTDKTHKWKQIPL